MYLTRTRAKFVSRSWSFTCSKYPVYPRYRVTAIESSTPSGRVERESPTTLTECISLHPRIVIFNFIAISIFDNDDLSTWYVTRFSGASFLRVYGAICIKRIISISRRLKAEITRSVTKILITEKAYRVSLFIFISSCCSRNSINSIQSIAFSAKEEI